MVIELACWAWLAIEPPGEELLAGPVLAEASEAGPTLIVRSFDGRLERLEVPPEEAAVDRLDLDEASRERVHRVIADRAAILDATTGRSVDLFLRMAAAGASGDNAEALRLFAEFDARLADLHERGTLFDELHAALPADARRQFESMVNDYRAAVIDEMMAQAQADASKRYEFALRLHMEERFAALTRSFERRLGGGDAKLRRLYEVVDATPEQEAAISALATLYFEKTLGMPDKQEEARFLVRLLELLTPVQRNRLISAYRRGEL